LLPERFNLFIELSPDELDLLLKVMIGVLLGHL